MAIRVRALLRKWFGRGQYPTSEQFSDLFDSFFHKTEDTIPISNVENLSQALNDKYGGDEGKELERRVGEVVDDLNAHATASEAEFNNVQNDLERIDDELNAEIDRSTKEDQRLNGQISDEINRSTTEDERLDGKIDTEIGRSKAEDTRLDGKITAEINRSTAEDQRLSAQITAEIGRSTAEDARLDKAIKDEVSRATGQEAAIRTELAAGDAASVTSANSHTDSVIASERSARESGDRATLTSAKEYTDTAVADLVNGSPETLDTLKELSNALGDDPNFATTVAGQIGAKVDKVSGKGLSTEDYTSAEKSKLAGIATGANNYQHPAAHPASIITEDTTRRFVTDTEKLTWNGKAEKTEATTAAAGLMSAADKQKLDGVATGANNYTHPANHPATMISLDTTHRFVTDAEKSTWSGKAEKSVATTSADGLMSSVDKKKLDGVAAGANNYSHPANHPATIITQDATHRFVSDTEKATWSGKADKTAVTTFAAGLMSTADKQKLDGVAVGANNYTHPASHPATIISQDTTHRFVTDVEKSTWNSKPSGNIATPTTNGVMSADDKQKLDGIDAEANRYTHPVSHPASMITEDSAHRFVSDTEKTAWNETPAQAKSYTDAREELIRSALDSGDAATLTDAEAYADGLISDLVDSAPAGLNTLKKLASAIGDNTTFSTWVTTQLSGKQATIKNVNIANFNSFDPSTLGLAVGECCNFNHYSTSSTTGRPSMGTGTNLATGNPLSGIYGWSGAVTRIYGTYYMVTAYGQSTTTGRPQMATRVYNNTTYYDWVLSTEYASKSSNGYIKLPSGIMIQWGALGRVATGVQYTTVYFPISFSSAPYFVTGCLSVNPDLTAAEVLQYDTLSVSSMTVARRAARDGSTGYSGQGVLWIALGTWK